MGNCIIQERKTKRKKYQKSHFQLNELIGRGTFGQIWKVTHKDTGEIFALKIMDKGQLIAKKSVKAILKEKKILETLASEGSTQIASIRGTFQDRQKVYILMQFISGRTLSPFIMSQVRFTEQQIKFLVHSILNILLFVHRNGVIHGDLKPDNIIINLEGQPVLTDFGTATYYQKKNSHQNGGTLPYMAPQILMGRNHSYSIDYYAIGILTFILFFQRLPFVGMNESQIKENILNKPMNKQIFPQLNQISNQASDFIIKLLQKDEDQRLGCNTIEEIFQHPWLNSQDNHNLMIGNYGKFFKDMKTTKTEEFISIQSQSDSSPTLIKSLLDRDHVQQMFQPFDDPPQERTLRTKILRKQTTLTTTV